MKCFRLFFSIPLHCFLSPFPFPHWTVNCNHSPFLYPLLLLSLFFSILPWLNSSADVVHKLKLQLIEYWKSLIQAKLVYTTSLTTSLIGWFTHLLSPPPAIPLLSLKCLLPHVDRAVWHRWGISIHLDWWCVWQYVLKQFFSYFYIHLCVRRE